jgi:hypothetical protein
MIRGGEGLDGDWFMSEVLERLWNKVSGHVDSVFFDRKMRKFMLVAFEVKERINRFLDEQGVRHVCGVFPDAEPDWPKVDVKVLVEATDFSMVLQIWEQLCKVGYHGLPKEDARGVFISVNRFE